jgi:hypothetical protein
MFEMAHPEWKVVFRESWGRAPRVLLACVYEVHPVNKINAVSLKLARLWNED